MFVFDPYSPEMDSNPFPAYETLREQYPCMWSEQARMWILSRYDDIANAVQDWQTYSSAKGNMMDELPGRTGFTLGSTDPPRHDRLRALIMGAFTKKSLEYLAEPARKLARQTIDEFAPKRTFDFVTDFSSRVTVGTLFLMMGLPDEDHTTVRRRVLLMIQSDKATRQKGPEHIEAFQTLVDYVRGQVAERRLAPKDDLITKLIESEIDGDRLAENEIVMTSMTLIMAGVESLSSFMSMMALNMHDFPDARRKVIANPELMAPAIEESLRFNTSAQRFRRVLMRDVELHGQRMRAGDFVCLCYGSGNRDPRKFPNPDVYDVERRPQGHLGFGGGKHLCLGTAMARLVTETAMREFFARIPEYGLTIGKLNWTSSTTFRSPTSLPFAIQ